MNFCENCGAELTSLFCEHCGAISSSNIPNSYSTDDSLAGLLSAVINQGKPLLFSELFTLTNSRDRTFRIFSQLEKTNNFWLIKQSDDFIISIKNSKDNRFDKPDSIKISDKLNLFKDLLEIMPLTFEDINSIFHVQVNLSEFQNLLGNQYQLCLINKKMHIKKK